MVSVGDDALNQDLVDQGAINQIVGKYIVRPLKTSFFFNFMGQLSGLTL